MQKLLSLVRAAVDEYHMIEEGDRIAVGVSGGKDSVALLTALSELRRFYPQSFTLRAFTVDPQFTGQPGDFSQIAELCKRLDIPYLVHPTQLGAIIFEDRKEKNPCSLCARMRRGILHDLCLEYGCNKIALGHNLDDAAETFLMNLVFGGQISCFSPVSYLSRKDLTMIRPLLLMEEQQVRNAVNRIGLPVVKSRCPVDGETQRQKMQDLLLTLEKDYPGLRQKIVAALQRGKISGF